ncbi:short-chain dehydrogenase [Candidatus Tenderia electrophaga]|jgi:rhamnose utilization protein RhaD (predicted bifunctional aldolase and dehydrogenase)/NAD(P)-dependent dehydrogenase (short-subunit alcohol dehydrogenase family)|uniref:Short-chain dehydrogenase n=1 Tax=Candidatus Tenderia electrophaga TaxID=1748243 RepID=A0A0S2TEB8_9GAMM|nr:short-chain dehydrogenase [Candidatus Tenderia electrophaga]
MKSLWDDNEAKQYAGELSQRVYTSRLLGRDTSLVLHGGGNTSVKITATNLVGEEEELLCVKGSGWDLETIDIPGFPAVKLEHLIKLAKLDSLSDPQMVNELRTHMTDATAPTPSVEAILHATLPYKYVDHTHADAVVTVCNTPHGLDKIKQIYGDSVVIVPYIMPGFDLARQCAIEFAKQRNEGSIGMVLMHHGIFSFGDTAQESYQRMIRLVGMAEDYIREHGAWELDYDTPAKDTIAPLALAQLRQDVSKAAGFPLLLRSQRDAKAMSFINRSDVAKISQQGPATPDHVIRTKRLPLVGRDVKSYIADYKTYFEQHAPRARAPKTMLDPAPRVILDKELGMVTAGKSAKEAKIVADIYDHTMDIITRAELLGGWQALPAKDLFDMEYWDLEQAKLRKGGKPPVFQGEAALVTGAASGIGRACVDSMLARGAAVIALDIDPAIETLFERSDVLGIVCDVGSESQLQAALKQGVATFGGLDMLVLNAGIFPGGCRIDNLSSEAWRKVMNINLDANLILMREAYPYLKLAPQGGRVVAMGSKNVLAPGPGAVAYSASKAALTQITRVAALEWGADNIRVNTLHPDCVYDTGIWTDEVLAARAEHYGLTVDEYKTKNVLKTEVSSHDVAELTAELCGPLFAKTTAAQLPIDGGNERVI